MSVVRDHQKLKFLMDFKGLCYVVTSSIILYSLFRAATNSLRQSEKRVTQKEERLRQIIDIVPHFVFAKNMEGRFILANRAIAQAYGTTVEGLVGKKDADFILIREGSPAIPSG